MSTLVSLLRQRLTENPRRPALRVKRDGEFVSLCWDNLGRDVLRMAGLLTRLGVSPGERVIQVSENRYEWIVADLAILLARAVHVPVHATLTGRQIAYQMNDCEPRLAILSGPSQAEKLVEETLPGGLRFVSHDACRVSIAGMDAPRVEDLYNDEDERLGERLLAESADEIAPHDLATILYTSGTTGEPKGVMLSHANLVSNAEATLSVFEGEDGDVMLNWLPLSHIYARTCDLYLWLAGGHAELALAESRDTIIPDCLAVRPTTINSVPYFYDKVYRHLAGRGLADTPGSVSAMLGGRMRVCAAGGAALADHVAEFFNRQGLRLLQGYGLSETSPVVSFSTEPSKVGSIGRPIPGVEVRFAEDGELLIRGPNVMQGYWKKPPETAEAVRDGWLHTGDLGRMDEDGYLYITGRKKELIVTAAGKNIAPALLESLLAEDPLILQAMVIGDGRNYLTALIVPEKELLAEELNRQGVNANEPRVHEIFAARIDERLRAVSQHEQIGRFTLLDEPFTPERDELTPTLKLRRNVVAEHYAAEIEAMYTEQRQ